MNSLDGNVILRYILKDIPDQSAKAAKLINSTQCYVSDVVITEITFVLEKVLGIDRKSVGLLLKKFLSLKNVACSDEQFLVDVIDLYETKQSLSFPDCYAAEEARLNGFTLRTFDKKLINQGGSHVSAP